MDKKVKVYKKYFETADDKTALVMHRGYALNLVQMFEELEEENKQLKEKIEDLEYEIKENSIIWENDGEL